MTGPYGLMVERFVAIMVAMAQIGKVTLVTWVGGGNTSPMLELGRRLAASGHKVSVCGPEILQDSVDGIGAQLVPPDRVTYPDVTAAQQGSEQSALDEMMFGLEPARSIATTLDETRTDVAVVDCMQFGALLAASAAGIPTVPFLHTRYGFFTEPPFAPFIDDWIGPPLAMIREAFGLSVLDSHRSIARQIWEGAPVAVSMLPPVLESELSEPVANVVHAGPLFSRIPQPSRPPAARPKILVSFSTTMMDQSEVLSRVLNALGSLEVDGLLTLGGVAIDLPTPPENVDVVPWLDPFDELPTTSLVVTHAGMGTVLATLAHGIPLLTLPMGRDQDGNAARVEEIGAGHVLPVDASSETIAELTTEMLGQGEFSQAARRVALEIRALDGSAATNAIEQLIAHS
jgi:UDP:flavonoid glycosyltransferase YjiC (YdhE family)